MAIDILVAGVRDPHSTQVEKAVRQAVRDVGRTDALRVALLPSDRDGRWDVGLNGPGGWAIRSFDSDENDLPMRAASEVRQLLEKS